MKKKLLMFVMSLFVFAGNTMAQNRIISEDDMYLPEPSSAPEDILVKRTIKANTWSTLTLPFELWDSDLTEIFGDDMRIAKFVDFEKNENDQYVLNFEELDIPFNFNANCPYLIKSSKALTEFLFKSVEVDANEEEAYIAYDNGRSPNHPRYERYAVMIGTLRNGVELPDYSFFLRDNKFYFANGSVLKGFRAYFVIDGLLDKYSESNISFCIDGEATAIDGMYVNGTEIVSGNVYSVNGTFMGRAENVMKSLPHGVYIVNNKKVVVK